MWVMDKIIFLFVFSNISSYKVLKKISIIDKAVIQKKLDNTDFSIS